MCLPTPKKKVSYDKTKNKISDLVLYKIKLMTIEWAFRFTGKQHLFFRDISIKPMWAQDPTIL